MGGDSSSSGEEDGDAEWRAAIKSVVFDQPANGTTPTRRENKAESKSIKVYQIKAQKVLDEMIEKSIEIVPTKVVENGCMIKEDADGGVRLFRDAPIGILFDQLDEVQGPLKRPRILPNTEVDEKSRKFRKQVKAVAVDGNDIINSAKESHERCIAKLEARDAAAKAKAKKEEERVAELKKIRGERWLPTQKPFK